MTQNSGNELTLHSELDLSSITSTDCEIPSELFNLSGNVSLFVQWVYNNGYIFKRL
jgi:hypothetical protein